MIHVMGLQRFPWSKFRKGANLRDSVTALDPNEAQRINNVDPFSVPETIRRRKGKTRFDASGFPAAKVAENVRAYFFSSLTKALAASIDGDIYTFSTAGAGTLRFDGTAGTVWCMDDAQDGGGNQRLWCANGVDAPQKLDGNMVASAWANTPPNGNILRVWRNRMCIAGVPAFPMRLFLSNIGDPEAPAGTYGSNWIDIKESDDDLDPILWLEVCQGSLLVFKRRAVWEIYDSINFTNRRLGGPGVEDRFQSVEHQGTCYYFNRQGVYAVEPAQQPVVVSQAMEPYFQRPIINYAALDKARVAVSREDQLLVAFATGSNTANDTLLEGAPNLVDQDGLMPWTVHDLRVASMAIWRPSSTDLIYAGDAVNAKLHSLFNGATDDGAAIASEWFSGWRGIQETEQRERLRRVNLIMEGTLNVGAYVDFSETEASGFPVQLASVGMGTKEFKRARPETRGRFHAIKIRGVAGSDWAVSELEGAIRGGKEH